MKYCINCGTPLEDEAVFCEECGTKQESDSQSGNTQSYQEPFSQAPEVQVKKGVK